MVTNHQRFIYIDFEFYIMAESPGGRMRAARLAIEIAAACGVAEFVLENLL